MHLEGTRRLASPPEAVWAAMNDLGLVRGCLPGCERLERLPDARIAIVLAPPPGGIDDSTFAGTLRIDPIDPPHGLRIDAQVENVTAGTVRGQAIVRLTAEGNATCLTYAVDVAGDGTLAPSYPAANAYADDVIARFADLVEQRAAPTNHGVSAAAGNDGSAAPRRGLAPMVWVSGLIALVLGMLIVVARW